MIIDFWVHHSFIISLVYLDFFGFIEGPSPDPDIPNANVNMALIHTPAHLVNIC